jgi:hypothetical protein
MRSITPESLTGEPPVLTGPRRKLAGRVSGPWRVPLLVFTICQTIFLAWWAAFFPGLMSSDSLAYVAHGQSGHWSAAHSVLYDALVWLSLQATGDLAALTLLQSVAMSAALAHAVASLRELRVPQWWLAVAAIVIAALPSLGAFTVTVWKDVPFTVCAVVAMSLSVRLAHRPSAGVVVALMGAFLGVGLFRNNGFLMVAIASAVLVVLVRGRRRSIAVAGTAAVAAAVAANLFLYPALGVAPAPPSIPIAPALSDISVAYRQQPSAFTPADLRLMEQVAPLEHWRATSTCYTVNQLFYGARFSTTAADRASGELMGLWTRVLKRTPNHVLGARLCRGAIAWALFSGPAALNGQLYKFSLRVPKDQWTIATRYPVMKDSPYLDKLMIRPLSQSLNHAGTFAFQAGLTPQLEWFLWRGAFWAYLTYVAAMAVARVRSSKAFLALAAVTLGQQASVMLNIPAQDFRYMAASMFIGILSVPVLVSALRERRHAL